MLVSRWHKIFKTVTFLIVTVLLLWQQVVYGETIWVSPQGSDSSGIGSENEPYQTIMFTLTQIVQSDTILLQGGVYSENVIIDGYPDFVLAGASAIDTAYIIAPAQGAALSLITTENIITRAMVIENIYISHEPGVNGIGLLIDGGSPTVRGCTIKANNNPGLNGGGIYITSSDINSRPLLEKNRIYNNQAAGGAGIYCENTLLDMNYNFVFNNIAAVNGGAVAIINSLDIDVIGNELYRNSAVNGAGLFIDANTAGQSIENRLIENFIYENIAQNNGGAVYTEGDALNSFQKNTFAENEAGNDGGAIFFNITSNVILRDNVVVNNRSERYGGGFAFADLSISAINLWSNSITGNQAGLQGGALYLQNSTQLTIGGAANLTNNLFHNRAAGQLNNITSNASISNLNLSHNYWGSANQQLVSQQLAIPGINTTWTTFSNVPGEVQIKLNRTMSSIWFADGKIEFENGGLQPTGDSTLVIRTHPDTSFTIAGVPSILPKIYTFDWQNVTLTDAALLNLYLDSTELDLMGNPFFLNLRILEKQDTSWLQLETEPLKQGALLQTALNSLNSIAYTVGLDQRDNTPVLTVEPLPNNASAGAEDPLRFSFLQPMDEATILPENITLRGALSGKKEFLFEYDAAANIAYVKPQAELLSGENITVTLNDAFTTEQGENLVNGLSWQYQISALRGSADFSPIGAIQQRAGSNHYTFSDFDQDGTPELIELSDAAITVFRFTDAGIYEAQHTKALGFPERFIRLADLNNDFKNEIILFNNTEIKVYDYNITVGFSTSPILEVTLSNSGLLTDVKIIDLNNDGVLDMALLRDFSEFRQLDIYPGSIETSYSLGSSSPVFLSGASDQIDLLDWNTDGLFDLVVSNGSADNNLALITNQRNSYASLINTLFEISSQKTLLTANVWNDGFFQDKKEVIVGGTASATNLLKLFNVDDKGNFAETHRLELAAAIEYAVAADFNSDGFSDLAVSLDNQNIVFLLSDNNGNITTEKPVNVQINAQNMKAIDYDADGDMDLFLYRTDDGITSWQILQNISRSPRSWFVDINTPVEEEDGSFLKPFKTINQALAMSFDGDSIFVTPGFYNESLTIRHSLLITSTDTARFVLRNNANDVFAKALIDVDGAGNFSAFNLALEQQQNNAGSTGLRVQEADSVNFANMFIRNFTNAAIINASNSSFNGVLIEDNDNGLEIQQSNVKIDFSNFERNRQYALKADNSSIGMHETNVHDNAIDGGAGIQLINGSQADLFEVSINSNFNRNIYLDNSELNTQFAFIGEAFSGESSSGISIDAINSSRLNLQNTVIADNYSFGVSLDNSHADIINSIFANNDSLAEQAGGGIVAQNNSTADIRNSIFFANNVAITSANSTVDVNYNNFYQNRSALTGTSFGIGNMNKNPLFVFMYNPIGPEKEVNDFHNIKLAAGSPLIDKGDPELKNGNSQSRSDIGLYGNLGLPYALESVPQASIEKNDSTITIQWQPVDVAERNLWFGTAVFRDTLASFEPDTNNMLAILPKSVLDYTDNSLNFGKEYFYRLAYVDSNGGAYAYGDTLNTRIDFNRLDLSVEKLSVQLGQGDTLTAVVNVANSGTLPVLVEVSEPEVDWLRVFPGQRLLQRSQSSFFRLLFNATGLQKDSLYSTTLQISAAEDQTITRNLSIKMLVSYRDLTAPTTTIQGVFPDTIRQAGFSIGFSANDSVLSTIGTPTDLLKFSYRFARIESGIPVLAEADTTRDTSLDFYPLADGKYVFEVAAIDTAGNGGLSVNSRSVSFNVKASSLSIVPKFWQMVTIPRRIVESSEKINSAKIASLRHWEDDMYTHISPDSILPGKSYWVIAADKLQLDLNRFDLVASEKNYSVSLAQGWNMIGSPWSWNIALDKMSFIDISGNSYSFETAISNGLIDPGIYNWQVSLNDIGYKLETSGRLRLNTGYWLKTSQSLTLHYDPAPQTTVSATFPKTANIADISEFDALIRLKVKRGNETDNDNYFGLCADKSLYPYYFKDAGEPPAINNNIRLYSQIEDAKVTTNIETFPAIDSIHTWDIVIEGNLEEKAALISWEKLNPSSPMEFYLYHLESGQWLNVNDLESLTVQNKKLENHFKLFATTNKSFEPEILPTKFKLAQNYPNPFNPSTTINLAIPYFADGKNVRIDVYDILGRKVKNLINRKVKSGVLKVEWDGQTSAGHTAASGIYIYHVKAAEFNASKKMILIR